MTPPNSDDHQAAPAKGSAAPAPTSAYAAAAARWRRAGGVGIATDIALVAGGVAMIVAGMMTHRFFSLDNARAILASTALVGITAIGATMVMIAGGTVSLAVSQTATVVAMIFLSAQRFGLTVAILLALVCGAAVTALQGAVVGFWTANPIVLTIAVGFAIGGVATWISGGTTVYPKATGFESLNSTPLGLPLAVYVLLAVALLAQWLLVRTTAGRQMYLLGENPAAARAAGLPAGRITVIAWAFFGVCIALTGVFLASFNTSANAELGGTLSLDAIAAVLAGGTAIGGGKGSALRTLGGAVLISVISDLLLLRGLSTGVQLLVKGLLVLLVVIAVHLRAGRVRR
jgi:ribose/xylose/arabinose/galactoside ABC-type transport system permease subunit